MSKRSLSFAGLFGMISLLFVTASRAVEDFREGINLPVGVTESSIAVYDLHMIILWVCVVIAIVVFGAMFYSMYAHRKSKGYEAAKFDESTTMEIIWTVVPFVILIGMAIPATKVLLAMEDPGDYDMTIKVTGYQWKWQYEYLPNADDKDGKTVGFFSSLAEDSNKARQLNSGIDVTTVDNYLLAVDKPLVIPAGKRIRFVITAADVLHAWWVPDLGWKKDAIPGFINEAWTEVGEDQIGKTFRGKCAELCGRDHGFMPIEVKVESQENFDKFLASLKAS